MASVLFPTLFTIIISGCLCVSWVNLQLVSIVGPERSLVASGFLIFSAAAFLDFSPAFHLVVLADEPTSPGEWGKCYWCPSCCHHHPNHPHHRHDPRLDSGNLLSKAPWKRALVFFAGPLANYVTAIAIAIGLFYYMGKEVVDQEKMIIGAVE